MKMKLNNSLAVAFGAALAMTACTMYSTYDEDLVVDEDSVIAIEDESSSSEDDEKKSSAKDDESSSSVKKGKSSASEGDDDGDDDEGDAGESSSSSKKAKSSASEGDNDGDDDEGDADESSSSTKKDDSSSSENKDDSSSSVADNSCSSVAESSSSEEESSSSVAKERAITGYVQKGPLVVGSTVAIHELKSEISVKTDSRNYDGEIQSNDGKYAVTGVLTEMKYAEINAEGYFFNEVSGENSGKKIGLNAFAKLDNCDTANVNVLTHLEHARLQKLVSKSKSIDEAKKEIREDLYALFHADDLLEDDFIAPEKLNIFGSREEDRALLAISVLVAGRESDLQILNAVISLANSFAGKEDAANIPLLDSLADWAESANIEEIENRLKNKFSEFKGYDFEKYIRNFWNQQYGLGKCEKDSLNKLKHVSAKKSKYYSSGFAKNNSGENANENVRFICSDKDSEGHGIEDYRWRKASDNEKNVGSWTCKNGEIFDGSYHGVGEIVPSKYDALYYVCDRDTANSEEWVIRSANDLEIGLNEACLWDRANTITSDMLTGLDYKCHDHKWQGYFVDVRDDKTYLAVKIGDQVWMAENLNYNEGTANSYCYNDNQDNCDKYGRLYTWSAAIDSVALANDKTNPMDCGYGKTCTLPSVVQGVCPSGWHLPSQSEWNMLLTTVGDSSTAGTKLKTQTDWNSYSGVPEGTDAYGFSALPAGLNTNGRFYSAGSYAYFWSSTENGGYNTGSMALYYNNEEARLNNSYKNFGFSVRCVKNSN